MPKVIRPLLLLALLAAAAPAPAAENPAPEQFDTYYMVFLVRGDDPPTLDAQASRELQDAHLRHLDQLWRDGHALIAGPFGVGADDPMRGVVLFHGGLDMETVRELAEADPAVQAGRLKVEVRRWYTGAGHLAFPKLPVRE